MADNPVTSRTPSDGLALPVPVIVVISIGAYIVLLVILLIIRQCLMKRGFGDSCRCCGKEGEPQCCECWIACCESCACGSPTLTTCLDAVCPSRKKLDCADIVMCQCCASQECCGSNEPLCDCGNCNCNCQCQPPECDSINCCCFELKLKDTPMDDS